RRAVPAGRHLDPRSPRREHGPARDAPRDRPRDDPRRARARPRRARRLLRRAVPTHRHLHHREPRRPDAEPRAHRCGLLHLDALPARDLPPPGHDRLALGPRAPSRARAPRAAVPDDDAPLGGPGGGGLGLRGPLALLEGVPRTLRHLAHALPGRGPGRDGRLRPRARNPAGPASPAAPRAQYTRALFFLCLSFEVSTASKAEEGMRLRSLIMRSGHFVVASPWKNQPEPLSARTMP